MRTTEVCKHCSNPDCMANCVQSAEADKYKIPSADRTNRTLLVKSELLMYLNAASDFYNLNMRRKNIPKWVRDEYADMQKRLKAMQNLIADAKEIAAIVE